MNTGQMMLTIFGLMLLSTIILRMNTSYYRAATDVNRNSYDVMAVSLATSYFEEVKRQAYDEKTVNAAVTSPSGFSASLGRESGESRSASSNLISANNFNDVDDFNNDSLYTQVPSGSDLPGAVYKIKCKVEYFNSASNSTSSSPQWSKKITVNVSGNAMSAPITLSTIFSYWKFR
jgi:hypothetical protein